MQIVHHGAVGLMSSKITINMCLFWFYFQAEEAFGCFYLISDLTFGHGVINISLCYQYIKNEDRNILSYMMTRGKKYGFKRYDGLSDELPITYLYHGVSFLGNIASATDVENYSTGFIAGRKGISWASIRNKS